MKRKIIRVTVTINEQDEVFTADGSNRLESSELAVSCSITYGNGAITPTAQISIFGLPLDKMLKLMRVQWNTMQALLNVVQIEVGDDVNNLTMAYRGNITLATIGANESPNIPLIITSQMAAYEKARVASPYTSPKGESVKVADLVEQFTKEMGYEFQNDGVDFVATDITLEGAALEKIQRLAIECDFDLYVDQRLICICKKGEPRTVPIPIISPQTGLIGYPIPDQRGISFRCIYSPLVKFGGIVRIQGSLLGETVNLDWRLYGYTAELEANIPNGKWEINGNATWRDSKYAAVQK